MTSAHHLHGDTRAQGQAEATRGAAERKRVGEVVRRAFKRDADGQRAFEESELRSLVSRQDRRPSCCTGHRPEDLALRETQLRWNCHSITSHVLTSEMNPSIASCEVLNVKFFNISTSSMSV